MSKKFGAQYWSKVTGPRDNSAINNGGYFDREQAENPEQRDRFGEVIDRPARPVNWAMEFPYGS